MDLIAAGPKRTLVDRPGGIFVRRGEQMSEEDRIAAADGRARRASATARARWPSRSERRGRRTSPSRASAARPDGRTPGRAAALPPRAICAFFNGLGGFTPDGREYVITLAPGRPTPGAVGERDRQPAVRHRRVSESGAPTPGRRTATSSGSRPGTTIRSPTPAARRSTSATRRPGASGRRRRCPPRAGPAVHVPPRIRLQHLRVHRGRHHLGAVASTCAIDAPVKFVRAQAAQPLGRRPPALSVTGYVGVGARRAARASRPDARRDRDRPGQRRAVRPQRLQPRVRRPGRLRRT